MNHVRPAFAAYAAYAAFAATFFAFACGARTQIPTGVHVVASQFPLIPVTRLFRVDATTGQFAALPSFGSDSLAPLAIALDPFDRHVILALDLGGGQSRVVRMVQIGGTFVELPLITSITGRVTQLGIGGEDLLVAVDAPNGGVFRMPRRGGTLTLVRAQANLTALHVYAPNAQSVLLGWTGRPGTTTPDSGAEMIDLATGQTIFLPTTFPNPTGRETTGIVDLPTGLPRHLLSFDDGTFGLLTLGLGFVQIPATPQPPVGACAAMKPFSFSITGTVVGGAPHPFVAEIDAFSGAFTIRSQALPGDPVDFAEALPATAETLTMSPACGPAGLAHGVNGLPQPGTTIVLEGRGGPPGTPAILVAGFDDFGFGLLPATLPGGCLLDTMPDAVLWLLFDNTSTARQPLSIPPGTAFLDAILFTQWLHLGAAPSTSEALAIHVGT